MTSEQFAFNSKAPAKPAIQAWTSERRAPRLRLIKAPCESVRPTTGVVRKVDGLHYRFGSPNSMEQLALANDLVTKRYTWRGYDAEGALDGPSSQSEVTFIASCGNQVNGTLTVRIDDQSPLLAEQLYPAEIQRLRKRGARLCEFGRLAFDEGINTLEILGPLFHLGMAHSRWNHGCTDMVIEVNPRHVGFYQRVFGFEVLGEERTCDRVAAPAVLLRLALGEAAFRAGVEGGERVGRRSIYPYCLGPKEMVALRGALPSLDAEGSEEEPALEHAFCGH